MILKEAKSEGESIKKDKILQAKEKGKAVSDQPTVRIYEKYKSR